MGKPISISQSHQLISVLANNVDWGALSVEGVQRLIDKPMLVGVYFDFFLECVCAGEKMIKLTSTTFGDALTPPFADCTLVEDGPGDDQLDTSSQLELQPILKEGETSISYEEAVNRSKDWGQRAAFALKKAGDEGKISKKVWPVGLYVVCGKTVWRSPRGKSCAWCVIRLEDGFYCGYDWFTGGVYSSGRRLVPRK